MQTQLLQSIKDKRNIRSTKVVFSVELKEGRHMLALRGKRKKLVKILRMENGVVYLTEEPLGSGIKRLPLVMDGKNVEEFELLEAQQISMFDLLEG